MPRSPRSPSERGRSAARPRARTAALTYVEIVVALAISAVVVTVAVISYGTIVNRDDLGRSVSEDVLLPTGAMFDFYGSNATYVAVSRAPNFAASAMAESLRERLYADVATATAVFVLARNDRTSATTRPSSLPLAASLDARTLTTPDAFRAQLVAAVPSAATVFGSYEGATGTTGVSLFILNTSGNATSATVRAIYETDLVTTTAPAGVYATVRRYQGTICTDYFHVFYPGETNSFSPLAVYFQKSALPLSGNAAIDRYRSAAERPFYFVWWPDPSRPNLASDLPGEAITSGEPRAGYATMADRTAFFFTLPAFPAL